MDLPPEELLAAPARGQGLPARAAQRAERSFFRTRQPDGPARAGAAADGRARRRGRAGLPARTTRSRRPGPSPSGCSSASGRTPRAGAWSAARGASPGACARSGSSPTWRARPSRRCRRPSARRSAAAFKLAEELGADTAALSGERGRPPAGLRAPAQRERRGGGQAHAPGPRTACGARRSTTSCGAAARSTSTSSPATARKRRHRHGRSRPCGARSRRPPTPGRSSSSASAPGRRDRPRPAATTATSSWCTCWGSPSWPPASGAGPRCWPRP